jgi:hypothetical protein
MPPVQAASGPSGDSTVAHGVPFMIPFGTDTGYGFVPNTQPNSHLQHNFLNPSTQPSVLQSNASTTPMPTSIQEVIDTFNANLPK